MLHKIKEYIRWMFRLWHPLHKTAYLLGTPTHDNIGDIAIAVAEIDFLNRCGFSKVVNITIGECWSYYGIVANLLPTKSCVFLNGGGNMGDIYSDESLRRTLLTKLNGRRVILFPESIYYRDTEKGRTEKEKSVQYYNTSKMTLFAREEKSYEIMKALYPKANVFLSPDIVLSLKRAPKEMNRERILLCFRDDQEKKVSDTAINGIEKRLQERGYETTRTSMIYHRQIPVEDWRDVVEEKMSEIEHARLMITDRLHGMVFAALTQTPCIVFGNNHHKVQGVYQWLKHLDYIQFAGSTEEALQFVDKLYLMENCRFSFDDSSFDVIKKILK